MCSFKGSPWIIYLWLNIAAHTAVNNRLFRDFRYKHLPVIELSPVSKQHDDKKLYHTVIGE